MIALGVLASLLLSSCFIFALHKRKKRKDKIEPIEDDSAVKFEYILVDLLSVVWFFFCLFIYLFLFQPINSVLQLAECAKKHKINLKAQTKEANGRLKQKIAKGSFDHRILLLEIVMCFLCRIKTA